MRKFRNGTKKVAAIGLCGIMALGLMACGAKAENDMAYDSSMNYATNSGGAWDGGIVYDSVASESVEYEMKAEHGLSPRYRLLLQVSAILQNCGRFVNNRSFHKHSFYLIGNSEIFGLRRAETEMTAFIARYSYRSAPKYSHTSFMSLSRETRVAISKLAAILRIADALNHGNFHDPNALEFERSGDELTVILPPDDTILLKARSLETQGKMFEDIFGIRILFRT